MAEAINLQAEARRRRILQNSKQRMEQVLGDATSNPESGQVLSPHGETNLFQTEKHLNESTHYDSVAADLINSTQATQRSEKEEKLSQTPNETNINDKDLAKPVKSGSTHTSYTKSQILVLQKKQSYLLLPLCIAIAMLFATYVSFIEDTSMFFILGYVVFIIIYLCYLLWNDLLFVVSDSFLMTVTILAINYLKFQENITNVLKVSCNFMFLSIDYFCLYSFFFFSVYKYFN